MSGCTIALKAKINILDTPHSTSAPFQCHSIPNLHSKKIQKALILSFEFQRIIFFEFLFEWSGTERVEKSIEKNCTFFRFQSTVGLLGSSGEGKNWSISLHMHLCDRQACSLWHRPLWNVDLSFSTDFSRLNTWHTSRKPYRTVKSSSS